MAVEVNVLRAGLPTALDELNRYAIYGATLAAYTLANIIGLVHSGEQIGRRCP